MKELGITEGEWKVEHYAYQGPHRFGIGNTLGEVVFNSLAPLNEIDAQFIAEAGTVANETGMMPREMKEKIESLTERLMIAQSDRTAYQLNGIDLQKEYLRLSEINRELLEACKKARKHLGELKFNSSEEERLRLLLNEVILKADPK